MEFIFLHQGEFYALCTAVFWTVTALAFESASLKVGSLSVNFIRLIAGMLFLCIFTLIARGLPFPTDASTQGWFWLIISGLIGFVFGDLFLFKSYTIIGSRFAMLIMALVPPITAFFGWLILKEEIRIVGYVGMLVTLTGIALAIISKTKGKRGLTIKLSPKGLLFAFGGAIGQALGLVLSKLGMEDYDPFAATQIRIIAGIIGFALLISFMRRWGKVGSAVKNMAAMKGITLGAFFGPFLGVSFSLLSILHTPAGIASTIMSIVPVLIILPAIYLYKHKVTWSEILGAVISVLGVAIFFVF